MFRCLFCVYYCSPGFTSGGVAEGLGSCEGGISGTTGNFVPGSFGFISGCFGSAGTSGTFVGFSITFILKITSKDKLLYERDNDIHHREY